jgi:hypothetical protein
MTDLSWLRKRPLEGVAVANAGAADEIESPAARVAYSSEDPAHSVEHLLDGRGSGTKSRRLSASAPRKCAWKSRRTEAARIAKF